MRGWSFAGGLAVCLWLGFGCGEDGKQVAHSAAGAAGDTGAEGGSDTGSGGSSSSAGEPAAGGSELGSGGLTQFLPLYENGTRLRAVSLGEPGSSDRKLLSWHDSELDVACNFQLAEDGELRCLPFVKNGLQAGFADAACEEPVLYDGLVTPCATRPLFQLEALDAGTCTGYRVLQLTEAQVGPIYTQACDPDPLTLAPTARVYTFEAMAPEAFASGERRERLNEDGFGVLEIIADDGARQVVSITTAELGECQVREVAEGGLRCVPHRAYLDAEWWFAGEGCSGERLAYAIRSEDCTMSRKPEMALTWPGGDYQELPSLFAIGDAVEGSVYQKSGNTCTEEAAGDVLWSLHPLLEPLDLERVLGVTIEPQGSGRARLAHYSKAGTLLTLEYRGSHQGQHIFHDQQLDAPCFALPLESGDYVCLPDGARGRQESMGYSDPDCTEPVLLELERESDYFAPFRDEHCSPDSSFSIGLGEVYEVADAQTGDVYVLTTEDDCELLANAQSFVRLSKNDTFPLLATEVE